jgi:hypothetical protein
MHEVTFNNSEAAAALGQSALTPHDMMEYLTAWWHARQGDSYDALFTPLLRGDLEARGYSSQECLAELFESDSLFGSAQLGDKADT